MSQFQTIEKLESLLKDLDSHLTTGFEQNQQKIQELSERTFAANSSYSPVDDKKEPNVPKSLIEHIMDRTSYLSLLLFYTIDKYLDYQIKKPISLHRLSDIIGLSGNNNMHFYFYAFVVSFESIGLVKYSTIEKSDIDTMLFKEINSDVKSLYMKYLKNTERYKTDIEIVDNYLKTLCDSEGGDEQK